MVSRDIHIKGFLKSSLNNSLVITSKNFNWLNSEYQLNNELYAVPYTKRRHLIPFKFISKNELNNEETFKYKLPQQHMSTMNLYDTLIVKKSDDKIIITYIDAYTTTEISHMCVKTKENSDAINYECVSYVEKNTSHSKTPRQLSIGFPTEKITLGDVNYNGHILALLRRTLLIVVN